MRTLFIREDAPLWVTVLVTLAITFAWLFGLAWYAYSERAESCQDQAQRLNVNQRAEFEKRCNSEASAIDTEKPGR